MVSCYDSFNTIDHATQIEIEPNSSISYVHAIYKNGTRYINQDLVIEGTVTANDEHGNLFKSFIIESDGYAIEVLDGLFDSYVRHPVGSCVTLKLKGLSLDRYMGVLRVGLTAPATSSFPLDYMSSEAIVDLYVTVTSFGHTTRPTTISIHALKEDQAGQLININNLKLHTEDGIERQFGGYALFRDQNLDSIWCYTSPYSNFATETIPQSEVSLKGIIQFGNTDQLTNQFIIKPRGLEDCKN